jgi:hypothetical protein
VVDFEELRELAADVRIFIDAAEDKAAALRDIVAAYDVVFGIFPAEDGVGVHIVKGRPILDRIANSRTNALYTHTAIAVPDVRHAEILEELMEPAARSIAA